MAKNFRISDEEEIALQKKAMEISMERIQKGKPVITDSKLLHKIIEISLGRMTIDENGEIVIK